MQKETKRKPSQSKGISLSYLRKKDCLRLELA